MGAGWRAPAIPRTRTVHTSAGWARRALRPAGARITRQPRDTEYGSRADGATDLEERRWSFGTFHPTV